MSNYTDYYTHEQIARKLGVKHTVIRYLIESGELKHHSGRFIDEEYGVRYTLPESEIEKARQIIKEKGWDKEENQEDKPDLASTLFNVIDEETIELFGEEKARELREKINARLKEKGLDPISWKNK